MISITGILLLKLGPIRRAKFIPLLVLMLLGSLFCLPIAGFTAQDGPEVNELKQKATNAYIAGHYSEAEAVFLEIAEKHPDSEVRRYAVSMLGNIYEEHIVDLKKAIRWDREFLDKYADRGMVSNYRDKIAYLEKQKKQEQAFKTYNTVRFSNKGDAFIVRQFEELLKNYPDFTLRADVERELGYTYQRMEKDKESAQAFQALSRTEGNKLSPSDRVAYKAADRYWQMTTTWAWAAWTVLAILWVTVLLMKPWDQITWASIRKFLLWPFSWALLTAAAMPTFYSFDQGGYLVFIHGATVYIFAGLNLTVLIWLLLLTRAKFWQTRPNALRWLSPVLTLLMTVTVLYLFILYQPVGPEIIDIIAETFRSKLALM